MRLPLPSSPLWWVAAAACLAFLSLPHRVRMEVGRHFGVSNTLHSIAPDDQEKVAAA